MTSSVMAGRGRVYRSNPGYRLRSLADLASAERNVLARVADDPEIYGVLVPREHTGLTIKLVNRDTADLFRRLVPGGRVPGDRDSGALTLQLRDMVAAEILEVEDCGVFRTGLGALPPAAELPVDAQSTGGLMRISLDAVRHADSLRLTNPAAIADCLYAYHRIPVGPAARRHWARDTVAATLTATSRSGGGPWRQVGDSRTWSSYSRPHPAATSAADSRLYKLYVSPMPEQFLDAVAITVGLAAVRDDAAGWKAGNDCYGVLRPDKLIVYLDSMDAVFSLADDLRRALAGMSVHGVPFTADLGGDGLLSWGVDPPRFSKGSGAFLSDSWRTWLTHRLAATLWEAARRGVPDVIDVALRRLDAVGVDARTWTPASDLFGPSEIEG
ncbi:hypothetical protein [Streptomyces sp. Root1310]|uniref:hypothetical protein n=1 Tax=Streptomyces sp. Root1310 TaxID=1736452 RepID=UPI000711071B|nr:hypothetical protein [Streptomyces sp. Root1310]KQX69457.1 hypothetical protein ASD48_40495 [Streptomyces sp. Root1310]